MCFWPVTVEGATYTADLLSYFPTQRISQTGKMLGVQIREGDMVEVTCDDDDDDEGFKVFCLKSRGNSVDDVTRCFCVPRWQYVNSDGQDTGKLLWQIIYLG